jgi:hypothetical protein
MNSPKFSQIFGPKTANFVEKNVALDMSVIIADRRWQTSTLHIDIRASPPVLSMSLWIIKLNV